MEKNLTIPVCLYGREIFKNEDCTKVINEIIPHQFSEKRWSV